MDGRATPTSEQVLGSSRDRFDKRTAAYALLLTALSIFVCFHRLSEGTLFGDEAAYACTTERMKATGDWIVPRINDEPHLNATPLYNWLTLLVDPWIDDGTFWHRFWPAVFGVGCVLATFLLGWTLFTPNVGLFAGLLIVFNRDFIFMHGIRFAGMESMTTFFITSAICVLARIQNRRTPSWGHWAALGVIIGIACLTKPPAFGGFIMATIGLYHLTTSRGALAFRLAGPSLALACAAVVAAPWYLALCHELGVGAMRTLFIQNSVGRAFEPTRNFLYWHSTISHSSFSFKVVDLAFICGFVGCWGATRRPQVRLIVFMAASFLGIMSAVGKGGHYIFYVFPVLAVLLAWMFLVFGPVAATRLLRRLPPTFAAAIPWTIGIALLGADAVKTIRTLDHDGWQHPTQAVYEFLEADIKRGELSLVLFDFPTPSGASTSVKDGFNFEDYYYTPRMTLAKQIDHLSTLQAMLATGQPAVVLMPPASMQRVAAIGQVPNHQIAENPWPFYVYPILVFNTSLPDEKLKALADTARGSAPSR